MSMCGVRVGFFVLRDCPEQATATCALCARPVCAGHMAGQHCIECAAIEVEDRTLGAEQAAPGTVHSEQDAERLSGVVSDDPDAAHFGYRAAFYRQFGFRPSYAGTRGDPHGYYDDHDRAAFVHTAGAALVDQEDPARYFNS